MFRDQYGSMKWLQLLLVMETTVLIAVVPAFVFYHLLAQDPVTTTAQSRHLWMGGWIGGLCSLLIFQKLKGTVIDEWYERVFLAVDTHKYEVSETSGHRSLRGGDRGRLTPVDVVFIAVSVAVFAFLVQPFYSLLQSADLGVGAGFLFQMIPAGLVMSVLVVTYATALGGGR